MVVEFDKEKWARKVFKIYKSLKFTETKLNSYAAELVGDQTLLSKKLFRLVVVLYNLKQGKTPHELRESLQLDLLSHKTDDLCGETVLDNLSSQTTEQHKEDLVQIGEPPVQIKQTPSLRMNLIK